MVPIIFFGLKNNVSDYKSAFTLPVCGLGAGPTEGGTGAMVAFSGHSGSPLRTKHDLKMSGWRQPLASL